MKPPTLSLWALSSGLQRLSGALEGTLTRFLLGSRPQDAAISWAPLLPTIF